MGFIPQSLGLRSIVLHSISIHQTWAIAFLTCKSPAPHVPCRACQPDDQAWPPEDGNHDPAPWAGHQCQLHHTPHKAAHMTCMRTVKVKKMICQWPLPLKSCAFQLNSEILCFLYISENYRGILISCTFIFFEHCDLTPISQTIRFFKPIFASPGGLKNQDSTVLHFQSTDLNPTNCN